MNYARREERIPRGILSGSLLSAVIAAAYRDLVVHTPALVLVAHVQILRHSTMESRRQSDSREDNNYFFSDF